MSGPQLEPEETGDMPEHDEECPASETMDETDCDCWVSDDFSDVRERDDLLTYNEEW